MTTGVQQFPGFKRIRVAGTPFERGLRHGRLLRDDIRALRQVFYREVVDFHGRALGLALRAVMAPFLASMLRYIPIELRREMRGVARGAGVPYYDVVLFNCFDDLLHALALLPPLLAKVPFVGNRFACSSFALTSQRTSTGTLLHGRNLDYEVTNGYLASDGAVTRALREHVVVIEHHPDRGRPFISVGWPGVVGVVTAVNDAGLSLACQTSPMLGETPNGLPLPLLYRCISQYADSLEKSEALLRNARRTIGNNVLIASAVEDHARVFELTPKQVVAREPSDGVAVTTNHFIHHETRHHQEGWFLQGSFNRHGRLSDLCSDGPSDPPRAASFLRDKVIIEETADHWSCLENPGTIYSSVAEPASGRLWLRVNDHPDRDFVELNATWADRPASALV